MTLAAGSHVFVGRGGELATVRHRLDELGLGIGSALLVMGPAGVGKSRFLDECATLSGRYRTVRSLEDGGEAASQVALIDDLDALCDRSAHIFEDLLRQTRKRPLTLIATLDDTGRNGERIFGARVARWRAAGAGTVRLPYLSPEETELLVRGIDRDAAIEPALLQEIVRTSGGNPKYVVELALVEHRKPPFDRLVPPSAQQLVQAARKTLAAGDFDILRRSSILGDGFCARWIVRLCDEQSDVVAGALQAASDAGLIVEDVDRHGWFAFADPAVAKALYASLVSPQRERLHRLAVERLARLKRDAPLALALARQAEALGDRARARRFLLDAAALTMRAGELNDATSALARAAEYLAPGEWRWVQTMRELLRCRWQLCQYGEMVRECELVLDRIDAARAPEIAADILKMLFYAHLNNDDRESAHRALRRLTAARPPAVTAHAERFLLVSAYSAAGQRHLAEPLLREANPASLRDPTDVWRYTDARLAYDSPYESEEELDVAVRRTVERATDVNVLAVQCAYLAGAGAALQTGIVARAIRYCAEAAALADGASGDVAHTMRREVMKYAGLTHFLSGDLAAAEKSVVSNVSWKRAGFYNESMQSAIGVFVGVRAADIALINSFFEPHLLRHAVSSGEAELCGMLFRGYAETLEARSMIDELRRLLRKCLERQVTDPYLFIAFTAARHLAVEELATVTSYVCAGANAVRGPVAAAHHAIVLAEIERRVGREATAREHALSAAQIYGRFGWRLSNALALEIAGEFRAASIEYDACGASADVARLATVAQRRFKRNAFGKPLTPKESQVAALISRGYPDKRIAAALGISVRTVHIHVGAVLRKLGASSRTEIAPTSLTAMHRQSGGSHGRTRSARGA